MIDLFAGVGGLSLGFEQMGFDVVLANEYDKSIAQAYIKNRKNPNMIIEDITKLPIHDTFKQFKGTVDLCVGGHLVKVTHRKVKGKPLMILETFYSNILLR